MALQRLRACISRSSTAEKWMVFHRVLAIVWLVNIPIALATPIKQSLAYLIIVSLMTAFSGEMAALHGTEIQVTQEEESQDS